MAVYSIIDDKKKTYKAELHAHSSVSDGAFSPEELKKIYLKRGVSIVLFADHDVFICHNGLTDKNFLALNGYELNVPSLTPNEMKCQKVVHLNFLATNPKINKMVGYNPQYIFMKNAKQQIGKFGYTGEIVLRDNSTEFINGIIKKANENGFMVTYNHPVWSLSNYNDYIGIDGLFAIEAVNTGSIQSLPENRSAFLDTFYAGKPVNCVFANDFHRFNDSFDALQSFTYIQPETFSYNGVIKALKEGKYFSSCGPLFYEMKIDGDTLKISCSDVKSIYLITSVRDNKTKHAKEGEVINGAEFKLGDYEKKGFFVMLCDKDGKVAYSNPVYNYGYKMLKEKIKKNKVNTLFLHGRNEKYNIDGVNSTYLVGSQIEEQIKEIENAVSEITCKKLIVKFGDSEITGYDYYYLAGEKKIIETQDKRVKEIDKSLKKFIAFIRRKKIHLTIYSMTPVEHSGKMYDYRNNYAKKINKVLKKRCSKKCKYIEIFDTLTNEKGILNDKFVGCVPKIIAKSIKENFKKQ